MSRVGLIVLAAGSSSRMGRPKQLLQIEGRTLVRRTVDAALGSVCRPVVVVVGAQAAEIRVELESLPVRIVDNLRWQEGMASSLIVGLETLLQSEADLSAVVITLCDQPYLTSNVLNRLVDALRDATQPAAASSYSGRLGAPAVFARSLFPELLSLRGDEGARKIIQKHAAVVVDFPGGAIDLDTPEDLERFADPSAS